MLFAIGHGDHDHLVCVYIYIYITMDCMHGLKVCTKVHSYARSYIPCAFEHAQNVFPILDVP